MKRIPVQSSNLVSVGYNRSTQVLEVEFHGGRIYQYFGVPLALYDGLMNAPSKGQYLDQNIKKEGYTYIRVK
ncbi:KTSC domain-containing protein [candidate division TA06 bacterium B3_TA06]|uniref:KTSC domain-containing protein n=1 Tax=candidate division TA06 bacterium B3_TA06 TaxID=2012487 RepID=A0A532V945_UNCT6|nr:MAG: KTSC domain-containing protein [candidate division TA06 bacterium B3_TA06]